MPNQSDRASQSCLPRCNYSSTFLKLRALLTSTLLTASSFDVSMKVRLKSLFPRYGQITHARIPHVVGRWHRIAAVSTVSSILPHPA